MKITNFFKTFETPISLSGLTYINNHYNKDKVKFNSNEITSEILDKSTVINYAVSRDFLKQYLNLVEIDKVNPLAYPGYVYLINRCQYDFNKFLYDPKGKYIIILNLIDDKIFGIQIRDITGKKKAKYLTLSLQKIHSKILKDEIIIPENIESLSTVFNIFNIDIYKPILVTEGPFDSFLLPNCIATAGASKSIGIDIPLWYVYDSDKTGNEHALKKLNEGYNVFLWNKFKNDLNIPEKNPYSKNKNKWDINDVIKWCRDNNYKNKIYWSKYFTNNILDGLDI